MHSIEQYIKYFKTTKKQYKYLHLATALILCIALFFSVTAFLHATPKEFKSSQSEFDPDLLYLILTAEMAYNRGNYTLAIEAFEAAAYRSNSPELVEQATKIALELGDFEAGIPLSQYWAQLSPDNTQAQITAYINTLLVNPNEAIIYLKAWIDDKETEVTQYLVMMTQQLAQLQITQMEEQLENVSDSDPQNAQLLFYQAIINYTQGQTTEAKNEIKIANQLAPEKQAYQVLWIQILMQENNINKAIELSSEFIKSYPSHDAVRWLYAKLLSSQNKYEEFITQMEQLLVSPKYYEAAFATLSKYYIKSNNPSGLLSLIESANKSYISSSLYHFVSGQYYQFTNQNNKAIAEYQQVTSGPLYMESQIHQIELLIKTRQPESALFNLQNLISTNPKESQSLALSMSAKLMEQSYYTHAITILTQSISNQPNNITLIYARALAAIQAKQLDLAENDLKAILVEQPEHYLALNALGYGLLELSTRYQEAHDYLKKAYELSPEHPAILDSLGWAHYRLGDSQQALILLKRAYELHDSEEIGGHLYQVLIETGQVKNAELLRQDLKSKQKHDSN